jgi:tRNA pseudouridine55 synthase
MRYIGMAMGMVPLTQYRPRIAPSLKSWSCCARSTAPLPSAGNGQEPVWIHPDRLPDDVTVWENAVLSIDKPQGWTSFDVCAKLRGAVAALLGKRPKQMKVGHAGTLDPMATGLLIVCVGKATKQVDRYVSMRKEYSGVLRLGEGTASYDADTEVIFRSEWKQLNDMSLAQARDTLVGEVEQLPPMYSAVKVGGKRLYESARAGKEVERKPRKVTVERFDLEPFSEKQDLAFYICCSKGTYVRSLAHQLGLAAGTYAHLVALRREAIGTHSVRDAWDMTDLIAAVSSKRALEKQKS